MRLWLAGVLMLCVAAVSPSAVSAQTGSLSHSPVEVVKKFIGLDTKGARLASASYGAVMPYMGWGQDPVWGHVVITDGSTIAEDFTKWEVVNTLEVVIPVTYTVLGSVYFDTGVFLPEPTTEEVRFRLKAVKNRWRIVEPILPPHVGHKRMVNEVRQLWLGEPDAAKRQQLSELQDALKQAKAASAARPKNAPAPVSTPTRAKE